MTNFSPIQYVYNVKSPFVVEKNDINQKKKFFCSLQDIHELMNLSCQLPTLVNGMIFKDENVLLNNLEIRMSRVLECLFWWLQILIHYLQNIIVHEFQRTPGCN